MAAQVASPRLPQPAAAPKFSRYRSVRQASTAPVATGPAPPLPTPTQSPPPNDAIARSRSRYHRPVLKPPADPLPQRTLSPELERINRSRSDSLAALTGESRPKAPAVTLRYKQRSQNSNERTLGNPGVHNATVVPQVYQDATLEAREILRAEEERLKRLKAQERAAIEAPRPTRRITIEAEPTKHPPNASGRFLQNNGRVPDQWQDTNADEGIRKGADNSKPPVEAANESNDTSLRQKLRGLSNSKSANPTTSSRLKKLVIGPPEADAATKQKVRDFPSVKAEAKVRMSAPARTTNTFDAPISAVNAGERRVTVKCNNSTITLPVTPTTTARELVNSASTVMSEPIDPRSSILVETFGQLGLERPLRKYEHVRDVLNSWDHDHQNCFTITPPDPTTASLLELDTVSTKEPQETSLTMYHSPKPGKWNKRVISLRSDGQVTVAKRQGDSDTVNICHLSDFDIYTPTQKQMKKLKAPKKNCWAIKSLQKSAFFLEGQNFVHFFATSDKALGDQWYTAVQSWRSRYLVHVLGEGQTTHAKPANALEAMQRPSTSSSHATVPYQLGSFQPLLGPESALSVADGPPRTQALHRRNMSSRDRRAPPSAFPGATGEDAAVGRGRTKSVSRTSSLRSSTEPPSRTTRGGSSVRSSSSSRKPEPLVDLTPQWREQPQHVRKGRAVKAAPGRALIDLATEPAREPGAIVVPPTRDWRRPSPPTHDVDSGGGEQEAFTGKGLLARSASRRTQGGNKSGHGIPGVDGQPLVDLHMTSQFVEGSLLRKVEVWKGEDERGLVVDRQKRVERDMKVGEGFDG